MIPSDRKAPTADKLRFAIDREGQGDKVDFPDPAAAPLGTDEEASSNPATPGQLALESVEGNPRKERLWIGPILYGVVAGLVFGAFIAIVLWN